MSEGRLQGEFFDGDNSSLHQRSFNPELHLSKDVIKKWQKRIVSYQENLFKKVGCQYEQSSFFKVNTNYSIEDFAPLELTPLPISFWKWPKSSHEGPAIYVVMDYHEKIDSHLMLYIGETIAADKRWKGEHDCKNYLANYCESLQKAGVKNQLSIRFWTDVPKETSPRRKLEQELIQLWLPPFNKETKSRWATPFTSEII